MPKTINHRVFTTFMLLLLAALLLGCGGGNPLRVFDPARTITLEQSADVEVVPWNPVRATSVSPIPASLTIKRGGVAVFSARARDSEDRLLSEVSFKWRMRNPRAGSVSASGVFTAGSVSGNYANAIEVLVIQEIDGREFIATGSVPVLVTSGLLDSRIESIVVFPNLASGSSGDFIPLRAAAIGDLGGLVQDLELFWSLKNPEVGRIDSYGNLVIGDKPGLYRNVIEVEGRRLGGSGAPVVGTASVQVLSPEEAARGIRAIIGPTAVVGRSAKRVPLVFLAYGSNGRPVKTSSVRWEVLDQSAGKVDRRGIFTIGGTPGHYPGVVRGTGILDVNDKRESITATVDVVVQPPYSGPRGSAGEAQILPRQIRISPSGRVRLSALMFDTFGNPVRVKDPVWLFDPTVVAVDERNRLTAVASPGVYPDAIATMIDRVDGSSQRISSQVTILGPMTRIAIVPGRPALGVGESIQMLAEAFDQANNRLYNVRYKWKLAEGAPGTITTNGLYVAEDNVGTHLGAVIVSANQRVPR